jgi:hypothetical protein
VGQVGHAGWAAEQPPAIEHGALHLYQLYDVGYSIDLERAHELLTTPSARVRPVVTRGGRIDIPQLPLDVSLGACNLTLADTVLPGQLNARIYDLGILAFRAMLPLPGPRTWCAVTDIMADVLSYPPEVAALFEGHLEALRATLEPSIERHYGPTEALRGEEYTLLLVDQLAPGVPASQLGRNPALLQAALGERRPLSVAAQALATPLSYYDDDLILLTWAAAIVIEPDAAACEDATLLLEFANAQLLALRSYDAEVQRDLAAVGARVARPRPQVYLRLLSSSRHLHEIAALIADITDTSARVENALKVTEDVYWNRVYAAALATLRVEVWRQGIAEALDVLRQTAALLHDEAQEAWTTLLEVLVIVLIAVELIVALLGLRGGMH